MDKMYEIPGTLQTSFLSAISLRSKQCCFCFAKSVDENNSYAEVIKLIPYDQYCNALIKLIAEMDAIMSNFNKKFYCKNCKH